MPRRLLPMHVSRVQIIKNKTDYPDVIICIPRHRCLCVKPCLRSLYIICRQAIRDLKTAARGAGPRTHLLELKSKDTTTKRLVSRHFVEISVLALVVKMMLAFVQPEITEGRGCLYDFSGHRHRLCPAQGMSVMSSECWTIHLLYTSVAPPSLLFAVQSTVCAAQLHYMTEWNLVINCSFDSRT